MFPDGYSPAGLTFIKDSELLKMLERLRSRKRSGEKQQQQQQQGPLAPNKWV